MKVWPFVAALAEGGCKPPHAALAEDRRGERCGKGARDASGGDREDGVQSPVWGIADEVSFLNKVASKPGRSRAARVESDAANIGLGSGYIAVQARTTTTSIPPAAR